LGIRKIAIETERKNVHGKVKVSIVKYSYNNSL